MIRFNDFERQWNHTRDRAQQAFESVGESGWYILGREVQAFETELARVWGLPFCVGVASGLDALEIGLRALGCRAGDRVLTTPVSAFATTLAILKIGAVPVFVDVDEFGLIDLDACEAALAADASIRFMLPVHLYGSVVDLERLRALRERFGCRIVEDCAQAIAADYCGVPAGSAGDVAATSFYPTKNLGAMGDGGAILTADPSLAPAAACLRDYGQSGKYVHDVLGYNSRLDELQAALLRHARLPELACWTARRREIARRYLAGICNPAIHLLGTPPGSNSCWHLFPLAVDPDRKQAFIRHLADSGIATGEHYPVAIPDQKALREAPHVLLDGCGRARRLCRSEVSIPIHPYLTDDEVDTVIGACNRWEG